MQTKRFISAALAGVMAISLACVVYADGTISSLAELKTAFGTAGTYTIESDFNVTNSGITAAVTIDGKDHTLTSTQTDGNSTIYQNENVNSELKNITINGNTKPEVGVWEGAGTMTLTDSTIKNYSVSTVRRAAIGVGSSGSGKQGTLTLNNVKLTDNSDFDINISDAATVNINEGTELSKLRLQSNTCKLNIGAGWSGSFEITQDSPASVELGTIGAGADISGITISGSGGYYVENDNGKLRIANDNGAELHFDMNKRGLLYKGSTGFLYGEAEPNVPTIDLLQGLQPAVMVQKALGGLQHPTGDAIRTKSSLDAAGAKSIQVYLQDIYLEWPYNAPYKSDGSLDVDGYTKTCEEILYGMICDKANAGDAGAFLGSDGNYYILNKENAARYSYVLFNEPDQIWYGGNLSGLEAAWKQVYEAVHKIDPNAKCAGPNFANYNKNSYDNFLSYCKNNNCLPELISWHELGDSSMTKFFSNYDEIKSMTAKYYSADNQPELLVNEYARHYDIATSGGLVKWLAMFEDKDMDGCMAYWGMANSLNEVAADQNSPSSTWWVYHWYAQMTGEQVPLTSPAFANTRFYGLTAYDKDIPMAYVLFGGSEEKHGKETVYLDNMDKTALVGANGAAHVKIYGVGFSGQHGANYKPEVVFDGAVNVTDNTLKLQTTDTDEMDAFFAVVTPTDETGAAMKDVKISTLSYEAEDATLLGGAKAYAKTGWSTWAASGRKEVGSINNNGDGVKFTVNVPEDGSYNISLFYSLQAPSVNPMTLEPDPNGQNRGIGHTLPYGMQVDDGEVKTIYLDSTITWSYRNHHDESISLKAGEHTITFTHINGNEGNKVERSQFVAAIDKLDLDLFSYPNFEIDLTEMKSFRTGENSYEVTAVAPMPGYYEITGDGDFTLTRQIVDYAPDAKTYSLVSTKDVPVSDIVYLSQGANTIGVTGDANILNFEYTSLNFMPPEKDPVATIFASDMAIHGTNAYYKYNKNNNYPWCDTVITELGVGQHADADDRGEDNYIELNVNVKNEGLYNIGICYSNDEPAPVMLKSNGETYVHPYNIDLVERYAQIKVNDNEPETVYFRHTMSWETFKTVDMQAELKAGDNTIRIYNDNSYQFSPIVNSTAPEIAYVMIAKLDWDGNVIEITFEKNEIDESALNAAISKAEELLAGDTYSDETLAALQSALDSVSRETQSEVNKSRKAILDAIDALKPKPLNLADYYAASYASTSLGNPEYSYDGNTSTAWVSKRSASPYVAYEVFYAGDGKVFDLNEITMQGNSKTSVVYLGTDNDNILKTPSEMGSSSDLAKSGSNLYVPFAELYDAKILGIATGANVTTQLSGQYRYFVVALATWEETTVNELELSALVVSTEPEPTEPPVPEKTHITITESDDAVYADYTIVNETGELHAYIAKYDENGVLVEVKYSPVTENSRLEIPVTDDKTYTYKAFLWRETQEPVCDFAELK